MNCACGCAQQRSEQTLPSGHRRITLQCNACFRRETETRTARGKLILWTHDVHVPTGDTDAKDSITVVAFDGFYVNGLTGDVTNFTVPEHKIKLSSLVTVEIPCRQKKK